MRSVVRPGSCYILITLQIGAPEEGLWRSSCNLKLHALTSLAVNCCYLESKITGLGVLTREDDGEEEKMMNCLSIQREGKL